METYLLDTPMAGVMQSEFSLPQLRCGPLLSDLKRAGLVAAAPEVVDESEFIQPIICGQTERTAPFLSFWTRPAKGDQRRVDLHWIIGQDEIVAQVEEAIRRNGGVLTSGSR